MQVLSYLPLRRHALCLVSSLYLSMLSLFSSLQPLVDFFHNVSIMQRFFFFFLLPSQTKKTTASLKANNLSKHFCDSDYRLHQNDVLLTLQSALKGTETW